MKLSAVWIQWHRRIGLVIAPVLILLAITGVLINHSQSLGWHHKPVYSTLLAHLYGIPVTSVTTGYKLDGQNSSGWIYQLGDEIYRDQRLLVSCTETFRGVISRTEDLVLLCGQQLIYLTHEGELIEELNPSSRSISRIGLEQGRLIGRSDEAVFLFDENQLDWVSRSEQDQALVFWSNAEDLPAKLQQSVATSTPISGLNRERVLLDLHSGRLFGEIGVWVVDASGIILVFLALSGTLTWIFRSLRRRKR